jgi:hypothetical protein
MHGIPAGLIATGPQAWVQEVTRLWHDQVRLQSVAVQRFRISFPLACNSTEKATVALVEPRKPVSWSVRAKARRRRPCPAKFGSASSRSDCGIGTKTRVDGELRQVCQACSGFIRSIGLTARQDLNNAEHFGIRTSRYLNSFLRRRTILPLASCRCNNPFAED